jgi:alpha-ketoglutarate-dependent taurine dioxygenase
LGEDLPSPTSLFAIHDGKLNFRYLRQYIELGHDLREHPLSPVEIEALDILDSIIVRSELRIDMMLQPGDIQFANNHLILHSRTSFEDSPNVDERRKLLRLWLKMDNARSQPSEFPGRNGF